MEENKKEEKKKLNIYEVAGKAGKAVKKYGGIALALGAVVLFGVVKKKFDDHKKQ